MAKKIELSKQEIQNIKDLYENKFLSSRKIAELTPFSRDIIERVIREYNFSKKEKPELFPWLTREKLIKLYEKDKKGINRIAKELKVSAHVIKKYLKKYEIYIRERNELSRINIDPEELFNLYAKQKLLIKDIAKYYKCTEGTIIKHLKKYRIPLRTNRIKEKTNNFYHIVKTSVSDEANPTIKKKQQNITKDELENLYFNKKMTQQEIADHFKIGRSTASKLFQKYGIRKKFKTDDITKEFLIKHYVEENIPPCEIAKKFNLDANAVKRRIYRLNLKSLKTPEQIAECQAKVYNRTLSSSGSKGETEIRNLFPTKYHNISDIIGLELDLWYPKNKLAIEYNGDYWHSLKFHRNSGLHLAKIEICENKGIHLINIFERDWQSKTRKKIEEHIKKILYPEQMKTVNPYNCKIMDVGGYTQFHFERRCNLLNYKKSDHCVGLYDARVKNSISYNIRNNACEIIRFTTEFGYTEEYRCLIEYIKRKHSLPIIITYDKRYYNSEFATKLGFKHYKEIKPEVYYVRDRKAFRKNELTEEELSKNRYLEVYDCGFSQWILE